MRKRPAFKLPQTVYPDMRSFSCQLCTSKLKSRSNLNNHIKAVHEKDKPFECLICSVRFLFNSQLNTHSKTVHDKTYYEKCQLCIPEKLFSKRCFHLGLLIAMQWGSEYRPYEYRKGLFDMY